MGLDLPNGTGAFELSSAAEQAVVDVVRALGHEDDLAIVGVALPFHWDKRSDPPVIGSTLHAHGQQDFLEAVFVDQDLHLIGQVTNLG